MKNTTLFAALFGAASMFAAEPAKTTDVNDGFNKMWSYWNSPKVKVKYSLNRTEGAAAKNAGQITTTTPGSACLLNRFPVEPSSLYQIEVMAKSPTANAKTSVSVQDFGSQNKFVSVIGGQTFTATPQWTKNTYFFRTGKNTKTIMALLNFNSPNGGTVLFDDFKLKKVDGVDEFYDSFEANSWGFWKSAKAKMKSSHDKTVGKKSPGSVKIEVLPGNTTNKFSGCATKHLPVVPGKTYTLTVFVKTQGLDPNTKVSLSFQGQDKNLKFLSLPIPSRSFKASECSDWKQIIITRNITPTGKWNQVRNILVTMGVGGSQTPGCAWFDDFEFFVDEVDEE